MLCGTYAYDAPGRLASGTVTQSVVPARAPTFYVYDLNNCPIAETDISGATLWEGIWLDDLLPVAVIAGVNTAGPPWPPGGHDGAGHGLGSGTIYYSYSDYGLIEIKMGGKIC
jgi:hypothetical protein